LEQAGLSARGFVVRRLNTYNTVPVESLPQPALKAAKAAAVVAFASPSAVKAWMACIGGQDVADVAIACIGGSVCTCFSKCCIYVACTKAILPSALACSHLGLAIKLCHWNVAFNIFMAGGGECSSRHAFAVFSGVSSDTFCPLWCREHICSGGRETGIAADILS
jgi:hypothetical protein